MARNVFLGGAQTTPAKPKGRGPGNNRGGGPGRGNNRVPKGGLYGGKAGEAASNIDPGQFFRSGLTAAGVLTGTGSPADLAAQDAVLQRMMDEYGVASASNQRLSASDWMQKQYGAGWQGKKGKNFQGGTLSALQGPMAEQIQNQIANASPGTTIQSQLMNRGMMPSAGNDAFTQWLQAAYVPQQEARYNQLVQGGNPALNARDFAAGLDMQQARRAFAGRSGMHRQPSANAPTGGRWSWWS